MLDNILLRWRKGSILSATFLFLLVVIAGTSCKKKDNLLGGKMYNQEDLLNSGGVDTFYLSTHTIFDDSVNTKDPNYGLLGILNDKEFGTVDASFYTQVRLPGLNPNFGDVSGITIDSFILAMEYAGGYGYFGNQTFEVYELDERMYSDSIYISTKSLAIKSENWVQGSGTYNINPQGITVVGNDTVPTQLRIDLKPAKALQIIQDASSYPAEFGNNDLFMANYLKGIHVKTNGAVPSQNSGMVAYFNLLDNDSKMIIYYKENGVPKSFNLVFNSECTDYNKYTINNSGKRIEALIADASLGQTEFYAQAGSHRGVIDLPTVKNLPKNIVVHSAKLHLPIQHLPGSPFTYPPSIILTYNGGANMTDITATYDPYIKGYVADLQLFVQGVNVGALTETSFLISPSSFRFSANRIIFNGQNSDNKLKPKLIVAFTEF